jgi:hypothetical protein
VVITGALLLPVPPETCVYQFNEHPVELLALSVMPVEFLQREIFELLVVGLLGIELIVIVALLLESLEPLFRVK